MGDVVQIKESGDSNTPAVPPGDRLLDATVAHITRFVVFASEAHADVVALWIVHTHAIRAAFATPYLHIDSPVPGCGKSTLFRVLYQIVASPLASANATAAAIFRKISADRPTLMLDEIDAQLRDDPEKASAIRSILNAGYQAGPTATVLRCEGTRHEVREFNVFGPKAFAGINERTLHSTTLDRCVHIGMQRKRPDEGEKFVGHRVEGEAAELRGMIESFAQYHLETLRELDPELPGELGDRGQEVWEPLFAIAHVAGGDWPERARRASLEMQTGLTVEDENVAMQLLADLHIIFDEEGHDRLGSDELCKRLRKMDDRDWATWGSRRQEPGFNQRDLSKQQALRHQVGHRPTQRRHNRQGLQARGLRGRLDALSDGASNAHCDGIVTPRVGAVCWREAGCDACDGHSGPQLQNTSALTLCAWAPPDFLLIVMIDTIRQVPAPSADAWSLDLASRGGPRFVVLRLDEHHARQRLAEHLTWLGKVEDNAEGLRLIADIEAEHVAVIW